MYSKGGGKGGRHDWVPDVTNIGRISYVAVRVYQHSGGRSFRRIHRDAAFLGISTFAHLTSGAVLTRIPDSVSVNDRTADVSKKTAALFVELMSEKTALVRVSTALTTVQRKGTPNINIHNIEEEDGVGE